MGRNKVNGPQVFIWTPKDARRKKSKKARKANPPVDVYDFIAKVEGQSEVVGVSNFMMKKLLKRFTKNWSGKINGLIILLDDRTSAIASAVCSGDDKFDEQIGIKIAQMRLDRRPIFLSRD